MGGSATYGFILYYDLLSAVTAKHYMDGHNIKGNMLRVSGQQCSLYDAVFLKTHLQPCIVLLHWKILIYNMSEKLAG